MAHSGLLSKDIKLSYKQTNDFVELTDLQEIPELGGTVNKVDVTVLKDGARAYINGLVDYGDLSFKFLYDKTQFNTLNALKDEVEWKVELPDGLTATFSGEPSVKLDSAGIEAALTYTLSIACSSVISFQ